MVVAARLTQVRSKLSDLRRMQGTLGDLIEWCRATDDLHPCPIIEALVGARRVDRRRIARRIPV